MKITKTRKEFLSTTRTKILQGALNITQKKMELKDLYKSLRIASSNDKLSIQRKCSALQSELHTLRTQISAENVSYSLIKNWKNEKLKEELLNKFQWKIFYYFKFNGWTIDEPTLSLLFEDEIYCLISKAARIDKNLIAELESRNMLIEKIQKYGKEYAETLNLKHPFTDAYYAGSTECEYDRRDGWSFNYTNENIIITWAEDMGSCGGANSETKTLKIPLEYFSECTKPLTKARIDHKIGIRSLIEVTEKKINTTSKNIANLRGNIYTYTRDFKVMIADYKKFCGTEIADEAKEPFYNKIREKNESIHTEELKLKELQEQLKKYKLEMEK